MRCSSGRSRALRPPVPAVPEADLGAVEEVVEMMARADPTVDARGFYRRSPHSLEMVGRETIQRLGHRRRTPRHWHNYSHLGTIRHCLHKT